MRQPSPDEAQVEPAVHPVVGTQEEVAAFRSALADADVTRLTDGQRLELLHELELLTRTVAAVSARVQVGFYASQVAAQAQDGVRPSLQGKAVPEDLATARMCSPYWGSRDLTAAKGLCADLPRTLRALADGEISGYQARLVAEGTTCLDPVHRSEVDERLAPRLSGISNRELEAAVRGLVYEVDPAGFVERARRAAEDRGVSVRPIPDVMAVLSARLPAPSAIAAYHALDAAARLKRLSGDPRTVEQLRADELYERLTGKQIVDGIDVEVGLIMTDSALLAGTSDPAELVGYGPVPADYARELLRPAEGDRSPGTGSRAAAAPPVQAPGDPGSAPATGSPPVTGSPLAPGPDELCPNGGTCTDPSCTSVHGLPAAGRRAEPWAPEPAGQMMQGPTGEHRTPEQPADRTGESPGSGPGSLAAGLRAARVWVRRLYTDPVTGVLARRDPRRRFFTGSLRAFVVARDRTCRTPWCGAPIRAVDHIHRHAEDGLTDEHNGQGLCERCNLSRERPRALRPQAEHYRPPPPLLPVFPRPGRPPTTLRTTPRHGPVRAGCHDDQKSGDDDPPG